MHRSPMIKAHPKSPHLTKEQTRVPTAPLKSRPKGSALINDPLGIERDIISNFAEKIKQHPLKDYSIAKEKPKVEVVTLPKTSHKANHRAPTNDEYDQLFQQKRPQTSKGTRRSKHTDSEYHEQQPEDLVMFSQQLITEGKDRDPRKKPTTRIIFSAHTKRPKVVHLDEIITKNGSHQKKKEVSVPFETSIDNEFLSLFANKR